MNPHDRALFEDLIPVEIILPAAEFDAFVAELDKPAVVNARLAAAFRRLEAERAER